MNTSTSRGRIYGGQRPEFVPAYSFADAARYLCLPATTIRSWFLGSTSAGKLVFDPVLTLASERERFLTFENLVEAYVLAAVRRVHGIRMDKVRTALKFLAEEWGTEHPLARQEMLTDGKDLLAERFDQMVSLSQGGQLTMKRLLESHLVRIQRDPAGVPIRLFPMSRAPSDETADMPRIVAIAPSIQFGRPCIVGTGIPTSEVAERMQAGEPLAAIAGDFGRPVHEIEEAIRYELLTSNAA